MSMRQIYRKIAKENGVTVAEVKREMQAAINEVYEKSPNDGGVIKEYQNQVPRKSEVPTSDELIMYVVEKVKN